VLGQIVALYQLMSAHPCSLGCYPQQRRASCDSTSSGKSQAWASGNLWRLKCVFTRRRSQIKNIQRDRTSQENCLPHKLKKLRNLWSAWHQGDNTSSANARINFAPSYGLSRSVWTSPRTGLWGTNESIWTSGVSCNCLENPIEPEMPMADD